jgi:hypothetical protein
MRWDGSNSALADATITDGQGRYRFTSAPALSPGESYYVRFGPNDVDPRYVYAWIGPDIMSYMPGTSVAGGDFDIADVALLAPADEARVTLPSTFTWQTRGLAGDSYVFRVFELDPDGLAWSTRGLGDADSFTLTGPGEQMVYGTEYAWHVLVYAGPDSFGQSYDARRVTFLDSGGAGEAPSGLRAARAYKGRGLRRR